MAIPSIEVALALPWASIGVPKPSDTQLLVATLFKDDAGAPIMLTEGQREIFDAIFFKEDPRLQVMCYTQYGKSLTIALAVLLRAANVPEKWSIVAEKQDKASIIQSYIIGHIFDNDYTRVKFVRGKGEKDEDIRRSRNKNHITFNTGDGQLSEIFICTAKEALGKGAPNVVEDEAAFVEDTDQALVMRMLGGGTMAQDDGTKGFLCKVGNPFRRNHFFKTHVDPKYRKIVISGDRGVAEKRVTQNFLDEMKQYSYYKILYDCEFPSAQEMDDTGYMFLFSDEEILAAQERKIESYGTRMLGVDVARGGRNWNVFTLRTQNTARILAKTKDGDLMQVAADTVKWMKSEHASPENVFVDDTGVGGGVVDRLRELGYKVNGVTEGGHSEDKEYLNVRALMYAGKTGLVNWLKRGARLEPHRDWSQLLDIRYRKNAHGKTVIESKEDMRGRGVESPDCADALALTFAPPTVRRFRMQSDVGGVGAMSGSLKILT